MNIDDELLELAIGNLQEANEWAQKHNQIEQMGYIQDLTYEAILYLTVKKEYIL